MEFVRNDIEIWLRTFADFIDNYVVPSSRERLHYLLSKPKRRDEILGNFHTGNLFDPRCLRLIPPAPAQRHAGEIERLMRKLGASSQCYAFSFIESLDGNVDLKMALEESIGFCIETIIYCPQSKVAYWEGGHCDRWILCPS